MSKKKVLIVTDYFLPHWTGIVTSLGYFIEQYNRTYDFTVLTIQNEKKLPLRESAYGAHIVRVPFQFSLSRAKYSFFFVPTFISLSYKYDTIFINSPNSNVLSITLLSKLFRKRVVIFHQGDLILTKGWFNRFIEKIFDFQTHVSCMLADAVGTYTEDYAQHSRILSNYMNKLYTFLFIPKKENAIPKHILTVKKNIIAFGFAGRYVEEKGIDILLSAIELVTKQTKNIHFYFAGDTMNYEKNDYFDKINSNKQFITNLGLIDKESMPSFLSSLDYLIIPSRSDCFPLVQIEALQQGIPIIASNAPGVRVPVMKTHYGLLFEKENVDSLASTILNSIAERKKLDHYIEKVALLLNQTKYDKTIKSFIG